MKSISVLTGVRFQPEHFLQHMKKSKKFSYIDFSYVDTLYSPCWVFQLRVAIPVTKSVKRYPAQPPDGGPGIETGLGL